MRRFSGGPHPIVQTQSLPPPLLAWPPKCSFFLSNLINTWVPSFPPIINMSKKSPYAVATSLKASNSFSISSVTQTSPSSVKLLLSKLVCLQVFFQSSTWGELPYKTYKRLHTAVMCAYRLITCTTFNANSSGVDIFSDEDVIYNHNLLTPMTYLRMARLLLLSRVARKQPSVLVPLVKSLLAARSKGWSSALFNDFS